MQMNALTIAQLIGITLAYTALVVALPAMALRRALSGRRLSEKFLLCLVTGNAYVILLVFLLQLFRIQSRLTLTLGILIPLFISWYKNPAFSLKKGAGSLAEQFRRLIRGTYGPKSFWRWFFVSIGKVVKTYFFVPIGRAARRNRAETVFVLILAAVTAVFFGSRALNIYGYSASDTLVHNARINAMDTGAFFPDGFYPFGFHAVVYALHKLFGIRIFTLMRLFYFVTALFLVLVTYAFLRLLTRTRYVSYGFLIVLVIGTWAPSESYLRFYCTLPGEYVMLFALPTVYFILAFFVHLLRPRTTAKSSESPRRAHFWQLFDADGRVRATGGFFWGFCLCVALSLLIYPQAFLVPFAKDGTGRLIYAAWLLPVAAALVLELILRLIGKIPHGTCAIRSIALFLSVVLVTATLIAGRVRPLTASPVQPLEQNGAIICLTHILRTEVRNNWTVVSAGDETAMIHNEGGHYESLDFLEAMENYSLESELYIQTRDIYIFIEKRPLPYDGTLQPQPLQTEITASDAGQSIDYAAGYENYLGPRRKTIMAKLYYWARAYRQMFPESCTVYYEDDDFVCYRLTQNPARLHNLAIDYGYNM